jgi:hypothetical protein
MEGETEGVMEMVLVLVVDRWSFTTPEILVSTVWMPAVTGSKGARASRGAPQSSKKKAA